MRLKLRFSFTGYNAIKLFKHLMIQEGYPNTVTSGYVMDVAISLAKNYLVGIEEKDEKINYLLLAGKGEKSVIKYIMEVFPETHQEAYYNSTLNIKQSTADYIEDFRRMLAEDIYESRIYKQYAVKLLMIIAVLIKYNDINEYIIK